ncbi:MAG: protein TolQ [Pseudomonadota bacterium]
MPTVSPESMSLLTMVWKASLPVQLVMLLLVTASFVSWAMIFRKWWALKAAERQARRFEERFWSGTNLNQLYTELARQDDNDGMAAIFIEGFREYRRLSGQGDIESADLLDGVQRAMRVALSRETDELEMHLSFLATVGSTSPYVGLFGTVWGIMNSFRSLSTLADATQGIAEALLATAMGLFAAIPAVIAYNRYSNQAERLMTRYENFSQEFASVLQRQAVARRP